jgi:hypothetical protein
VTPRYTVAVSAPIVPPNARNGADWTLLDRKKHGPAWRPLVAIRNKSALTLAGQSICPAHTPMETGVEVYPTQINADPGTHFWIPSYFTQWYGASGALNLQNALNHSFTLTPAFQ